MPDVAQRLRDGTLTDQEFDALYPLQVRDASSSCWSPLAVIRRAVDLLRPAESVLDVGSGCGKFCVAGSVLAPEIRFAGIERWQELVSVAHDVMETVCVGDSGLPEFRQGSVENIVAADYDGLYLYNPFGANVYDRQVLPDLKEENDRRDFLECVRQTVRLLRRMPLGARVVTLDGFGGEFPLTFRRHVEESVGPHRLALWVRDADARSYPRAVETAPIGALPEVRAKMLLDRYLRLPVTRQGLIGVHLGLITSDEYETCSRARIDHYVLTRAMERRQTHDLERLVYEYCL